MPNWCYNNLQISGNKEVIEKIRNWHKQPDKKTDVGLFGLFYPLPKELENTTFPVSESNNTLIEKYGADNWYKWNLANWGVKWDASEIELLDETATDLSLRFETPWGPPIEFYEKLKKDFPDINIFSSYTEEGISFAGVYNSSTGDVSIDIESTQNFCLDRYEEEKLGSTTLEDFKNRLKKIYETNFTISEHIDAYEVFPDFWFECECNDKSFVKKYKITKENQ
jgi:hypothetical protein